MNEAALPSMEEKPGDEPGFSLCDDLQAH